MVYKCCVVPLCTNTSINCPQKVFVSVPDKRRKKWLQLARRDPKAFLSHSNVFMCEDHFDVAALLTLIYLMYQYRDVLFKGQEEELQLPRARSRSSCRLTRSRTRSRSRSCSRDRLRSDDHKYKSRRGRKARNCRCRYDYDN